VPRYLDFSSQPRQPQQVHIWNVGKVPLRINSITIAGADSGRFKLADQSCSQVAVDGSCVITVRFQPPILRGKRAYDAVLRLDHNGANIASEQVVRLRWTLTQRGTPPSNDGQPSVRLTVEPSSLSFSGETNGGTVTSLPQQILSIRNLGPGTVQNLNLRVGILGGGENKNFHHSSNCRTLQPGQSCREVVSFSGVAPSTYRETLYLADGLVSVLARVPLSATLAAPASRPAPPKVNGSVVGVLGGVKQEPPAQQPVVRSKILLAKPSPTPQVRPQTSKATVMVRPKPTVTPTPEIIH
jgi:hypothetical protein